MGISKEHIFHRIYKMILEYLLRNLDESDRHWLVGHCLLVLFCLTGKLPEYSSLLNQLTK